MTEYNKNDKLLNHLYNIFIEADSYQEEDIDNALLEDGLNPEILVNEGLEMINQITKQRKLLIAKSQISILKSKLQKVIDNSQEDINDIKKFITEELTIERETPVYQAFFRKLQSLDEKDLKSIKDDTFLLKIWEELEIEEPDD